MRNLVLATLATLMLGTAAFAQPAAAACWYNGYRRVCTHQHPAWWYRAHSHWCASHPYRCR